jgi:hypothetical protein
MGIPGQYAHERMRAAFETVARAAKGPRQGNGSRGDGSRGRLARVRGVGVRLSRLTCRAADRPAQPEMTQSRHFERVAISASTVLSETGVPRAESFQRHSGFLAYKHHRVLQTWPPSGAPAACARRSNACPHHRKNRTECELTHIYRPVFELLSSIWANGASSKTCRPDHGKRGFGSGWGRSQAHDWGGRRWHIHLSRL